MYKQPLSPPIFTEGRRGASVHRLFYEGDKKLLMNTIMNTEIMNNFPKSFVQDCISITIIFLTLKKQRGKIKNVVPPALITQHANANSDIICFIAKNYSLIFIC